MEHGTLLYELAWDGAAGRDGGRFIVGVTDPSQPSLPLDNYGYDTSRSGSDGVRSGPGRGLVGPVSALGRPGLNGSQPSTHNGSGHFSQTNGVERTDPVRTEPAVIDTPAGACVRKLQMCLTNLGPSRQLSPHHEPVTAPPGPGPSHSRSLTPPLGSQPVAGECPPGRPEWLMPPTRLVAATPQDQSDTLAGGREPT